MSEENRTPKKHFVEVIDCHHSSELASERENNLQSQLLDRRISSSEADRKINAIVAPLATQLETLIQAVEKLAREVEITFRRDRGI